MYMTKKNVLINWDSMPTKRIRNLMIDFLYQHRKYIDGRTYQAYLKKVAGANRGTIKKIFDSVLTIIPEDEHPVEPVERKLKITVTVKMTYKNKKGEYETQNNTVVLPLFDIPKGIKSEKAIKNFAEKMYNENTEDIYEDFYYGDTFEPVDWKYDVTTMKQQNIPKVKVPMKSSFVVSQQNMKYFEGITKKSFENMEGRCVYELLTNHLKPTIPTMSPEKLFGVFKEFIDDKNIDGFYLKSDPFNGEFTMDSGVNIDMVDFLCEKYKISHYAFDFDDGCIQKKVYNKSNHRPIAYYNLNQHMFLITDSKTVRSLGESEKAVKKVVSSALDCEEKKEKATKYDELQIVSAPSFKEALQYKDSIVIVPTSDLHQDVLDYIKDTKTVPEVKATQHKVSRVYIKETNTHIEVDASIQKKLDYTIIQQLCELAGVAFRNQGIGSFISEVKYKFFKSDRQYLNAEEKAVVIANQNGKCNLCENTCAEFELDHIQPLARGGTNEFSNFQALCKECHKAKTSQENENSEFIRFDEYASNPNAQTMEIFESQLFKQWAFVEKMVKRAPKGMVVDKIDANRMRKNILINSKLDYPIYSVMDYPMRFKEGDKVTVGIYYVETEQYFPFRGNGWYPYVMVQYGLDNKLITLENIKYKYMPSFTLNSNHFNKFVEYLVDLGDKVKSDVKVSKLLINSLVGLFGISHTESSKVSFTSDVFKASRDLMKPNAFVSTTHFGDNEFYTISETVKMLKDETYLPIYNQIIALEAIELHKLEQMIVKAGCVPMERNTDAILYYGKKKIDVSRCYWDDKRTIAKFKHDEPTGLKVESVCAFARKAKYFRQPINYNNIEENDDFDLQAKNIIEMNSGLLLLGKAGTGKTTQANTIISQLEASGKRVVKLAPTNKAMLLLGEGATTIHKFHLGLSLSVNRSSKKFNGLKNVDYIVIDEVSMMKEIFYRFFVTTKRYMPHIRFIVIGDFSQLKPVNDRFNGSYEYSPALHYLVDGNKLTLTKCRRSDSVLFDLCANPDSVDTSLFPVKQQTMLNLSFTHKTRKSVNEACMKVAIRNKRFLTAKNMGGNTQDSYLTKGMKIISFVNDKDWSIVNTNIYEIHRIDFSKKMFYFNDDNNKEQAMSVSSFCKYFYPAYCITIHSSQGQTFDQPYTIYDWDRLDTRLKYVALSRSKDIKNIQIF